MLTSAHAFLISRWVLLCLAFLTTVTASAVVLDRLTQPIGPARPYHG